MSVTTRHASQPAQRTQQGETNIPLAFTAHMNDASVSTSLTECSLKCRCATCASMPCTSCTSARTGTMGSAPLSSTSRALRRRAGTSRRGRFAGVTGTAGPGDAVSACRLLRGRRSAVGGGGSSAASGDGSTSGTRSYCTRYSKIASDGSVEKSICACAEAVSGRVGGLGRRTHQVDLPLSVCLVFLLAMQRASSCYTPSSIRCCCCCCCIDTLPLRSRFAIRPLCGRAFRPRCRRGRRRVVRCVIRVDLLSCSLLS